MIIHQVRQRSEEWEALRLGIPTASEAKKILTPGGKISAQAEGYLDILLAEWFYGQSLDDPETEYRSQWMERGEFLEGQARQAYAFETDAEVEQVGFITTDSGLLGCSPDGLIGTDGLLEIKVPSPKVHMHYMRTGAIEQDYTPQIQAQMLITERKWCDVLSYCPAFPTVIIRVGRDDKYQDLLGTALAKFIELMLAGRQTLIEKYGQPKWKAA